MFPMPRMQLFLKFDVFVFVVDDTDRDLNPLFVLVEKEFKITEIN